MDTDTSPDVDSNTAAIEAVRGGASECRHCRKETQGGIHNGCYNCGKVKHTADGRHRKQAA